MKAKINASGPLFVFGFGVALLLTKETIGHIT